MHQEINKSGHQQSLCMRISASKNPMRTLIKHISLKVMVKFTNLRKRKKTFSAVYML